MESVEARGRVLTRLAMAVLLVVGLGVAATSASTAEQAWADEMVYWSSGQTNTYHSSPDCAVRNEKNLRSGTIAQAKAAGKYNPCGNCKPGTGSSGSGSNAAIVAGWKQNSAGWWYQRSNGSFPMGTWEKIGGTWYLFDGSGYMRTGWAKVGGSWYYLDSSGAMVTGWRSIGGSWYYLNSGGDMATGWKNLGGAWYYLNSGGDMATGWKQVGGSWYYLNSGGDMATGWKNLGGTWYYLNGGGDMAEGWKSIGGTWYYLQPGSGAMATGWKQVGGVWYYLNGSGAMAANRWVGNYWVGPSGAMATSAWVDGGKYYVGSDGVWIPNYQQPSQPQQSAYDKALDQWIAGHITSSMTNAEKVKAIQMFTSYECAYDPRYTTGRSLLEKKAGDCVAGANFLVDVCKKLGIKAEVRFAGRDAEDYHINYGAAANHHNAFVWIDGVQYVADANPGTYTPMFLWEPDAWKAAYDVSNGLIPIERGPKNQEPSAYTNNVGATSYHGGYNVALGLTKSAFTVTNEGTHPSYPAMLSLIAYGHAFKSMTSSNTAVVAPSNYNTAGEDHFSATVGQKGKATLSITLDDGSVWTYTVTVA